MTRVLKEISLMMSQPAPFPATGITEALAGLQGLDELPTVEHLARLRAVHDALTAALAGIDEV